jgi:inosose dehydratase
MGTIRFGCQFYTWQMSGEKFKGQLPHICDIVKQAGFAGIEPEVCMMGPYYDGAAELQQVLDQHTLQLAAMCLVCDWRHPAETDQERSEADRVFDYLNNFSGTSLVLCQMPGEDRSDLRERRKNAIACINDIAARAVDRDLVTSFHPNSPPGSVFRTEEDYKVLLDSIDTDVLGLAPDSGHIIKGGIDVCELFTDCVSLIKHVHLKDITDTGQWAAMGQGITDFPRIVGILRDAGYDGWIMVEEESAAAEVDPDQATLINGDYLQRVLLQLV